MKAQTRKVFKIAILLLLLFVSKFHMQTSFARGIALTDVLVETWYYKNHDYIEKTLMKGDDRKVIPIINSLGTIWARRDGIIGSEIAPMIAKAFIYQTEYMMIWFSAYGKQFEAWLERLPHVLLTNNYGEPDKTRVELNTLKQRLIKSLDTFIKDIETRKKLIEVPIKAGRSYALWQITKEEKLIEMSIRLRDKLKKTEIYEVQ